MSPVRWPKSPRPSRTNEANIHKLEMANTAPDFTEMLFELEVWDLKHLNRLISQLKEKSCVSAARRVYG